MYYKCNDCGIIFDSAIPRFRNNPVISYGSILGACPKCKSFDFGQILIKDFKIFILDDNVTSNDFRSEFGVDLSSTKERSMAKNGLGYLMLFHISEFNKIDMGELSKDILQFIFDTTYSNENVVFNFKNEIIDLDPTDEKSHKLCDQLTELILSFNKLSRKITIQYGWKEAAGFKNNISSKIF